MKNKRLPLSAARPLTDNVLVGLRLVILQCIYECLLAGVSSRRTREIIFGGGWPSLLFYAVVMGAGTEYESDGSKCSFLDQEE